jgi:hypothetical protein
MSLSLRKRSLRGGRAWPKSQLRLENLEDRCVPAGTINITALAVPQAMEGLLSNPSINAAFTDTGGLAANQLTASIDYGDGTALSTGTITKIGATTYTVSDQHTFPEESGSVVPPFTFTVTLHVFENANAATNTDTQTTPAEVLDAPLSQGDPINAGVPTVFTGGGTGSATTAGAALANFEAAIGGSKNTAAAPQTGGFRTINWDAVKVDGTDAAAGPNSTVVINQGHTVGIALNRFQGQGTFFGAVYAVSNDGFADTNPNVGGANPVLFPAFSPANTFAMFNDNGIDFKFVVPSSPTTAPVSAATRGFGAIFLNVQKAGSTIEYFHGSTSLGVLDVPINATPGAAEFAGQLFADPIVTNVVLTLGEGVIFRFNGTTVTSGGANSAANNLVVTDDFAYPEPVPIANGFPIISGGQGTNNALAIVTPTVGVPFTGTVATFSDANPNANAHDYTATINWGDGHASNASIVADGIGGFNVIGTNTYATPGRFTINVDVMDLGGGPGPGGSDPTLSINNTANVSAGDQNHRFVAQAFLDLLQRPVDPSGLSFFGGLLDAGTLSRTQVVQAIEGSQEAHINQVNQLYTKFLHRQADPSGLSFFVNALANGATIEQVKASLLGSQEYFQVRGGDTNNGFLAAIYQDVLNRTIDPSGQAAFGQQLANGISTTTVATEIVTSQEAQKDVVDAFYLAFLRRTADAGGESFFVSELLQGTRDEQVIAQMVGSTEYFNRV